MIGKYNYGTSRRKNAVARVFIKPGKGTITVNDKPLDVFFSRETGRMIVRQPLELTNHAQTFDIKVNVSPAQGSQVRFGDGAPWMPVPENGVLVRPISVITSLRNCALSVWM